MSLLQTNVTKNIYPSTQSVTSFKDDLEAKVVLISNNKRIKHMILPFYKYSMSSHFFHNNDHKAFRIRVRENECSKEKKIYFRMASLLFQFIVHIRCRHLITKEPQALQCHLYVAKKLAIKRQKAPIIFDRDQGPAL